MADGWSATTVNLVALGLLGGAVAKSAQIPLQTWLPDAMEGPTPVSALIHAATMVTAGVYLLVRTHPIFEAAPDVQMPRRSARNGDAARRRSRRARPDGHQAGDRLLDDVADRLHVPRAPGVGAYAAAMFHLVMHAFFKALLFMAAGIVIHYLSGEQDMRKMGGLKDYLPKTWLAFLIGSLALVGHPALRRLLVEGPDHRRRAERRQRRRRCSASPRWSARSSTGLYTFRMFFLVWYGEPSPEVRAAAEHPHARGRRRHAPRSAGRSRILAVLSTIAGFLHDPGRLGARSRLARHGRRAARRTDGRRSTG